MVRHIVLWSLEGNLTKQEKKETAGKIKELLEPIKEKVPGAVKVEVIINELDSSNRDVALISEFTDTEALAAYQVPVLKATITQRVVFAEAVAQGKSIFEIDPNGPAALEMLAVLDELLQEHAP